MYFRLGGLAAAILLAGCGYVGDPLPPALNIPAKVTDVRVVQRGAKLHIEFTAPALTTEGLGVREFGEMELLAGTTRLQAPLPEPGKLVEVDVGAAEYAGKETTVTVRFLSPRGRAGDWSDAAVIAVRSPLTPPVIEAASHPEGIRVSWRAEDGVQYRITREEAVAGTVSGGEFIDRDVSLGKTYTYRVQAFADKAESDVSAASAVTARDTFAPKPPAGLTVVAGVGSVELTWERNAEPDMAGYRVYRAEGGGDFKVLADAVTAPAYSDRQVTAGVSYRYRVTALDRAGNEAPASAEVAITAQ